MEIQIVKIQPGSMPFAIGMTSPICAGVWSSKKSEKVDINILTGNL